MNLKLLPHILQNPAAAQPHFQMPQPLSRQCQCQLVAPSLILEPVDASEGLGDRHVENEMGQGEEPNGHPAVAALESRRLGLTQKDQT